MLNYNKTCDCFHGSLDDQLNKELLSSFSSSYIAPNASISSCYHTQGIIYSELFSIVSFYISLFNCDFILIVYFKEKN